jgi:hypothetical protein
MRRFFFAVLLGFSLGTAFVPAAEALDPESLRRDLAEGLKGGFSAYSTEALSYTGLETRAQGEAVRVEIKGLALPLPDLGGRLELGDLAFTVADAGPGLFRVSEVTPASEATLIDEAGNKTVLVNYRLVRLAGVWSAALRNFLELDAAITGFEAVVPDKSLGFAIAELTTVNRSSTRADGLTDMEGKARATGLRLINPTYGTLQIGELYADYNSQGQDLAGVQSFTEAFQALDNKDSPPDRSELTAVVEELAKINILPNGFMERFRVTDLTYLDSAQQPQFHLDEIEMDMVAGELHQSLGYGNLGMKVAGLRAEPPSGETAGPLGALLPRNLGFIASLERFPAQLLWKSILRGMANSVVLGDQNSSADAVGEAMSAEMLTAMNGAGTVLRLDRLDIETPTGRVIGEGVLGVDVSVPAGVKGRLDLTIAGLDEMISVAMSAATTEPGNEMPGGNGSVMFLMMLKSMAQREAGADGTPIDRFDIVLTPAGNVLVNGQPLGRLAPPQQ